MLKKRGDKKEKEDLRPDGDEKVSLCSCFKSYLATLLKGRSINVKVFTVNQARDELSGIIHQCTLDGIPVIIQCPKGIGAVLIDIKQWNEIQDTLYLISLSRKLKEEFAIKGNPLEEAMKELGFNTRSSTSRKTKTEKEEEGL